MSQRKGSAGGQKMAQRQREESVERYYSSPNLCKNCNAIIHVGDRPVRQAKVKQFCNRSCAGLYNNRIEEPVNLSKEEKQVEKLLKDSHSIMRCSKAELFAKRPNWQSARSTIQKLARKIFLETHQERACSVCGYDKHYEVAHIKSVSEFPDEAMLSEINDPENLIALCPNHHWEFDNSKIVKDMSSKIPKRAACPECNGSMALTSTTCRQCAKRRISAKMTKYYNIDWPTPEELEALIAANSLSFVVKLLGVTYGAVRYRRRTFAANDKM